MLRTRLPFARALDVLAFSCLIVAAIKLTWGLRFGEDIALYDESDYLYSGVRLLDRGFPSSDWAPLYAVWYFLLSLIEKNRVELYYLNYYVMVTWVPLATYLFLRIKSVPVSISFTLASWILLLPGNVENIQKIYHFSLILIFINLSVLHYVKNRRLFFFINSISSLLVSWARPEFFVAFALSSFFLFFEILSYWKKTHKVETTLVFLYLIISSILLSIFGFPLAGDRSLMAFGQHFALHWVFWVDTDMNPWTNWESIVTQNFGANVNSVKDALLSNPALFFRHILNNITDLRVIPTRLNPRIVPDDRFSKFVLYASVLYLCWGNIKYIKSNLSRNQDSIWVSLFFLIPCLISIIIINPRHHYLFAIIVLGISLAALLLTQSQTLRPSRRRTELRRLSILAVLLLILTPTPYLRVDRLNFHNLNTIAFLQSLNIQKPVQLLEVEGGYNIYAGNNYRRIPEYNKKVEFDCFLQLEQINAIVVSEALNRDARFKNDPQWQRFMANLEAAGFTSRPIPGTPKTLLLKSDLLP